MIECNSVTDNPLTDDLGNVYQGGNFQARDITSAMEKTRQGIQSLGRMLFAQCTEIIDARTNNGLAPNLTIDPPSQSFIMKGVDVMCASFVSELGFLTSPVGCHVQTAEMGNQALNSLALISARYTNIAADLLSKLGAAHLLVVCQALDLRAFNAAFLSALKIPFQILNIEAWQKYTLIQDFYPLLWSALRSGLNDSTAQDPVTRFKSVASSLQLVILSHMNADCTLPLLSSLADWTKQLAKLLHETYDTTRATYLERGNASSLLGDGTRPVYLFVRQTLQVPFLHENLLQAQCSGTHSNDSQPECALSHLTIGDYITKLHKAIRQGLLSFPVVEALKNVGRGTRARL
jgi:phenylalanine ammonia-lyase